MVRSEYGMLYKFTEAGSHWEEQWKRRYVIVWEDTSDSSKLAFQYTQITQSY